MAKPKKRRQFKGSARGLWSQRDVSLAQDLRAFRQGRQCIGIVGTSEMMTFTQKLPSACKETSQRKKNQNDPK